MNANVTTLVQAYDPAREAPGESYPAASSQEASQAVAAAAAAWRSPALRDAALRARALRGIAARLRARGEQITALCARETGLGAARLNGELARTTGQLEAFAALLDEGSWVDAMIDRADPAAPLQADVRRMLVALGPVAVFGAGNFPLAFSTAGGDTASALAAGCPVVFKGHPAHPGTSTLVAAEVSAAIADAGLPAGTFGHVLSDDLAVARTLIDAAEITAVAFTGSYRAGHDIWQRAQRRPRPIPVFAEMSSTNPVVVRTAALADGGRAEALAAALITSISANAGQLCTKPGIVFVPAGTEGAAFVEAVATGLRAAAPGPMLTPALAAAVRERLGAVGGESGLELVGDAAGGGSTVAPAVMLGSATLVREGAAVLDECFGPVVTLLTYADDEQLLAAIEQLPGQLTCTLHTDVEADPLAPQLADALAARCGRLLLEGMPTGVLVNHAMQHGGPWPSTTAPAHTSVGMTAIRRFLRPVAWQSAPAALLPPELRDGNPRGIWRTVGGALTRD